ncbi:MAG: HupE/UreJ family protein [Thiotrichaceae bacterium]
MNSFLLQGLQHPFLTPSHLIILVGLGVLFGQQGFSHSRNSILAFIFAALIGAWTHRLYPIPINIEVALLAMAAAIGILCALRLKLPIWITVLFALFCGVLIGQDSAPVMIPGIKITKIYTSLAGSILSATLFLGFISIIALPLRKFFQGIPLRVLGSWIFASSVMVLAFQFSTK